MRLIVIVLILGMLTSSCLAANMKALNLEVHEAEQRHLIEEEKVEVEHKPESTEDRERKDNKEDKRGHDSQESTIAPRVIANESVTRLR
ncbi:unnamed protein product [Dovyalis caffra]|uniref:Uncharacterized protein n=1 Tax=Dovyalis caffra TaxID=77055 RepID=A0AAV1RD57_9ROSI|nr:unnamed protein product [Dovyalis caffra]